MARLLALSHLSNGDAGQSGRKGGAPDRGGTGQLFLFSLPLLRLESGGLGIGLASLAAASCRSFMFI